MNGSVDFLAGLDVDEPCSFSVGMMRVQGSKHLIKVGSLNQRDPHDENKLIQGVVDNQLHERLEYGCCSTQFTRAPISMWKKGEQKGI